MRRPFLGSGLTHAAQPDRGRLSTQTPPDQTREATRRAWQASCLKNGANRKEVICPGELVVICRACAAGGHGGRVTVAAPASRPSLPPAVAVPAPAEEEGPSRRRRTPVPAGDPLRVLRLREPDGLRHRLAGNSSPSTSGNETLQCRGSVAPAPSGLEFYSGFPCYLPQTQDWTSNSQLTLRTNGTATLTCKGK